MRQVYLTFILLTAFLLGSVSGWAQDRSLEVAQQAVLLGEESPALQTLLERTRGSQEKQEFALQVLQEAQAMKQRGLPVEPYLLKANEGLAKGIPPERIVPALRTTLKQTQQADQLVERNLPRPVLTSPEMRRRATEKVQRALLNQVPIQRIEEELRTGQWEQGMKNLSKEHGKKGGPWNRAKTALSQETPESVKSEKQQKIEKVKLLKASEKELLKGAPEKKGKKGSSDLKKGPKKDPGWSFEKTKGVPKQKKPSSPSGQGQGRGKKK